MVKVFI